MMGVLHPLIIYALTPLVSNGPRAEMDVVTNIDLLLPEIKPRPSGSQPLYTDASVYVYNVYTYMYIYIFTVKSF
jgi:hypothetical protein